MSRKVTKGFFCSIHALFCIVIEVLPTRANSDKRHALKSSDSNWGEIARSDILSLNFRQQWSQQRETLTKQRHGTPLPLSPFPGRALLFLYEKCCFVLVVSFRIKLHPRLHRYVIKIDYQVRWSVEGLKRAICGNNLRRLLYRSANTCWEKRKNALARTTNKINKIRITCK